MRVEDTPQTPAYDGAAAMAAYRALGWRQRLRARRAIYRGHEGRSIADSAMLYSLARRKIWPALWTGCLGAMVIGLIWGLPDRGVSVAWRRNVGVGNAVLWSGLLLVKPQIALREAMEANAGRLRISPEVWRSGLPTPLVIGVAVALAVAGTWLIITLSPPIDLF